MATTAGMPPDLPIPSLRLEGDASGEHKVKILRGGRHAIRCVNLVGLRHPLRKASQTMWQSEEADIRLMRLMSLLGVGPEIYAYGYDELGPVTCIEIFPMTWSHLLEAVAALPTEAATKCAQTLVGQLCEKLSLVAGLGFVTLDLKPQNLVLRGIEHHNLHDLRLIDFEQDFTSTHRDNAAFFGSSPYLFMHFSYVLMLAIMKLHMQRQKHLLQSRLKKCAATKLAALEAEMRFIAVVERLLARKLRCLRLPLASKIEEILNRRPPVMHKLVRVLGCYQLLGVPKDRHCRSIVAAGQSLLRWLQNHIQDEALKTTLSKKARGRTSPRPTSSSSHYEPPASEETTPPSWYQRPPHFPPLVYQPAVAESSALDFCKVLSRVQMPLLCRSQVIHINNAKVQRHNARQLGLWGLESHNGDSQLPSTTAAATDFPTPELPLESETPPRDERR
jgi:hypothetical protein